MKRSRWLVPAGFFLALSGGGFAVSGANVGPCAELASLVLQADVAPDRRAGDAKDEGLVRDPGSSILRADVAPVPRSLRFAILRCQSPPRS